MNVKSRVIGGAKLKGLAQLIKKALPVVARQEIIVKNLEPVVEVMKSYAPKRTGASADTIHIEVFEGGWRGQGAGDQAAAAIGVGQDGFALRFSEYGTPTQKAKPALRPAWESMKDQVRDGIARDTAEAFRRLA